jgi:hypothetical protein
MTHSDVEQTEPLPAPISLTLEEAMQVAGGASPFGTHGVLVNGLDPEVWISSIGKLVINKEITVPGLNFAMGG